MEAMAIPKTLREAWVLIEDDEFGNGETTYNNSENWYGYGGYGDGYGGGGHSSSTGGSNLYKAFLQPFADVANTVAWGARRTVASTTNLLHQAIRGSINVITPPWIKYFFPSIEADYEKMRREDDQIMKHIDQQYADVLKRNKEVLHDHDAWGFFFFLDPSVTLGVELLTPLPEVAFSLIHDLRIGLPDDFVQAVKQNRLRHIPIISRIVNFFDRDIALYSEAKEDETGIKEILPFFQSKEFLQKFMNSKAVKSIQAGAIKGVVNHVEGVIKSIKTVEDVFRVAPQMQKLESTITDEAKKNNLNQEQLKQLGAELTKQSKKQIRDFWVNKIQSEASNHPNAQKTFAALVNNLRKIPVN